MAATGRIQSALDSVNEMLGISPSKALVMMGRAVLSIQDKGKRLAALEASQMLGVYYIRSVRMAVQGDHSETASKVKDALLEANEHAQTYLAVLADKDGSLSEETDG